jgi:hypothetical protein
MSIKAWTNNKFELLFKILDPFVLKGKKAVSFIKKIYTYEVSCTIYVDRFSFCC